LKWTLSIFRFLIFIFIIMYFLGSAGTYFLVNFSNSIFLNSFGTVLAPITGIFLFILTKIYFSRDRLQRNGWIEKT
jgi:hypothetical protein